MTKKRQLFEVLNELNSILVEDNSPLFSAIFERLNYLLEHGNLSSYSYGSLVRIMNLLNEIDLLKK